MSTPNAEVFAMRARPRAGNGGNPLEQARPGFHRVRWGADNTARLGDQGTNNLLVSEVLRTNEMQVWFLPEQLVPSTSTRSE